MPVAYDLRIPKLDDAQIVVDGQASEEAWARALVLSDFLDFQPVPLAAPSVRTEARILADEHGIHVFFHALDPEPDKVLAFPGRRDTRFDDDWVGFWIDPSGEAQRQYFFIVNAVGAQIDGVNPSGADEDLSWDGRWTSTTRRTGQGYDAELTIPWRSIRHPAVAGHCGIHLVRHVPRFAERATWPKIDPSIPGFLVQEALVVGPGALPPSRTLNLIPEITFGWDQDGPGNGRLGIAGVSPGATAEWAPGAIQLLATVNPDYSQVESDAAQISVNQRYALYYQEKRPFFTEGREWFAFPFHDELVYTRSMVTPLGGLRATGEWGPWTAAALEVVDQSPAATLTEGGAWSEDDLAGHVAVDSIFRLRRAMGRDASLGFIASDKEIAGTDLGNHLVGVDGRTFLGEQVSLMGGALLSSTSTAGGELDDAAGYVESEFGSKHVSLDTWGLYVGDDFRTENGFLETADEMGSGSTLTFDLYPHSRVVPKIEFAPVDGKALWTTASPTLRLAEIAPNVQLKLGGGRWFYLEGSRTGELFAGKFFVYDQGVFEIGGNLLRWCSLEVDGGTGERPLYDAADPVLGWSDGIDGTLSVRPIPSLEVSLGPAYERFLLDGDRLYEGFVARARIESYTSNHTFERPIVDRSTFDGTLDGELLLAWEKAPGTTFYLGGSLGTLDPLAPMLTDNEVATWQVFAKGSWAFAL